MIGRDEGAVPGATAAENREAEHCAMFSRQRLRSQIEMHLCCTNSSCATFPVILSAAKDLTNYDWLPPLAQHGASFRNIILRS